MTWQAFGDWGTSNLRLYRMEDRRVTASCDGPGIGKLEGTPASALRFALQRLDMREPPSAIRLVGMAGSRTGLVEAPYALCPAAADDWVRASIAGDLDGIPLVVGAGLACVDSTGRPDVMRGEEAQIFGAMVLAGVRQQGKAMYVLPGTHSKWANADNARIAGFQTFLSGELFDLLKSHSTLLAPGEAGTPAEEDAGFDAGLKSASQDEGLSALLFSVRSLQLRGGASRRWAIGYLSGLVIGDEVATMHGKLGQLDRVTLIGTPALCARYHRALTALGVAVDHLDGEACVLKGMELLNADH